eukprot:170344-Hanusia_phi.AAC.10
METSRRRIRSCCRPTHRPSSSSGSLKQSPAWSRRRPGEGSKTRQRRAECEVVEWTEKIVRGGGWCYWQADDCLFHVITLSDTMSGKTKLIGPLLRRPLHDTI